MSKKKFIQKDPLHELPKCKKMEGEKDMVYILKLWQ